MTVRHWCEADYYLARDRARKAWECSQPQLVLGLEQDDGPGTTSLVGSSSCSSPPSPTPTASGNPSSWDGEGGLDNHNQGGK